MLKVFKKKFSLGWIFVRSCKLRTTGAEITEYMYNDRHQLGGYRDGYLRDYGKSYTYTYDIYGRDLLSGLYNGTPSTNFTPTETLTEMIYGTSGIEMGKVKTSKSKILGTSDWLESTYHYTSCGRLDSVSGNNHINTSSGSTTTAHTYDGAGNIVRSQTSINAFGNTTTMQHTETIDHAGRPISEYIKINGGADRMIGQSVYNYKDQLITRYQGNTGLGGSVDWLQKTDYTYILDGLLSKINDNNLTGGVQPITWCSLPQEHTPSSGSSYDERDLFYSILHYDEEVSGSSAPEQYNGNIAHVEWQVKGRRKQMYAYTYDEYNRMTEAEYYDRNTANKGWDQSGIYDSEYTYDERGNILTLKRKGRMTGDSCFVTGDIDNLSYTYASNTNQLSTVTESASMTWGFKNPTSNTTPYEYDDNSSMTEDHYKGVVTVYNHLNLPVVISKGTDSIMLTYDAGGTLLRKQHKSGSTVVMTRDYIGGIEYVNDTLDAIYHSEGRIKYIDEVARYEYYIRDHLGNIRLTFSDLNADGLITTPDEIIEEMHYYPFGMMMTGSWMGSSGQYGYNGIEYENFLDLEMNLATYRGLDPTLGRWWQVDPKAEALKSLSPYNSMGNNPISFVDPEGDLPFIAVMGIGAATGIFGNGLSNISQGNNFFDGAGKAAFWGGIGAAASLGVGTVFGATGTFAKELGRAGAHALTQGGMSAAQGGSFWQGALSGGISSGIGSGIDALGGKAGHQILGGGLGGGIGSSISGGNFFDGFSQGVAVGAFNHALHSGFSTDPPWLKKLKEAYNNFWKNLGFGDDIPTYSEVESVLIETGEKVQNVVELQITAATFLIPGGLPAKGVTNLIPKGKLANHLFKGAGKLADTPANRTLIQNISNGIPLVVDKFGKNWYRGVDTAGNGIYSYTQNGVVKGAGYTNLSAAEIIAKYGVK